MKSAILMLQKEYYITMEDINYFHSLTGGYAFPKDARNSWTYLYHKLQEFEDDWRYHVHIENNILFPKVLELDNELDED